MKTKDMIICAVFAAIMCVCSVISIPIGPVPVSLGTFGVMITAAILGWKRGTISVIVFILIGAIGLPVFSGFRGGFQVILGPTGGYITSYIFMALIIGALTKNLAENKFAAMGQIALSCILGFIVCYFFGTLQFMFVQKITLTESLAMCVLPFIPFDIAKSVITGYAAYMVRKSLARVGLL